MKCQRPPASSRRVVNAAVERALDDIRSGIGDPELAWMFGNCFANTLDTTVNFGRDTEGHPDTYVITGDIDAMWLRDSTAQVWPFLRLAAGDDELRALLEGVVRRQTRCVLVDPYANAFYQDGRLGKYRDDHTEMRPGVHERKWELDSPAAFLRLSTGYWRATGDTAPFDAIWHNAVRLVLATLRVEQSPFPGSPYRFQRTSAAVNSLGNYGLGDLCRHTGLIRSGFRPSDDVCKLPFHIPSNAMMAVSLEDLAVLLDALGLPSDEARALSADIRRGLEAHATVSHPKHGEILAYEIDGYGGRFLMDDANVPSLLALPYLGFCRRDDPLYQRTRAFCLSEDNPYFTRAGELAGIGSPHTGIRSIWPLSLIVRAMTSDDEAEILGCLRMLKRSHAGTGFMHESFDPSDPARFTRPWFAWANTLFGELVADLHANHPRLLKSQHK